MAGWPSALRSAETELLGPTAARRRARLRRLQSAENAVWRSAGSQPGSWRDREAAARPALKSAVAGRRVSGRSRLRRNTALHARLVPHGGFAGASQSGLAWAAAGPRLGEEPATRDGEAPEDRPGLGGAAAPAAGRRPRRIVSFANQVVAVAADGRVQMELLGGEEHLDRVRRVLQRLEAAQGPAPSPAAPPLDPLPEVLKARIAGMLRLPDKLRLCQASREWDELHLPTLDWYKDLVEKQALDIRSLRDGWAAEVQALRAQLDTLREQLQAYIAMHQMRSLATSADGPDSSLSSLVVEDRGDAAGGLDGDDDDASDGSLSSLVVEDRGDDFEFSDERIADELNRAAATPVPDELGGDTVDEFDYDEYKRWCALPADTYSDLHEARVALGWSPTPFVRRVAQLTAVGDDAFDDEVLLAGWGLIVEERVDMGPLSEPSTASLTAPCGSVEMEQNMQDVRHESVNVRGFLAAGELLEAAASSRSFLVAASWLLGVPLEAPQSV